MNPTRRCRPISIRGRSRQTAPNAKLIVLPGVGHMVQNAAPDLVISEIEAMIAKIRAVRGANGGELASQPASH